MTLFAAEAATFAAAASLLTALGALGGSAYSIYSGRNSAETKAKAERAELGHKELQLALDTQQEQIDWQRMIIDEQRKELAYHQREIMELKVAVRQCHEERDDLQNQLVSIRRGMA